MSNKKGLNFSNWSNDHNLDGMKFFAELINEMLFDYTIDSYQSYTFNTHTLIHELNDVMQEVINGFIDSKALISIIDEIEQSIKEDFVIKNILQNKKSLLSGLLNEIRDAAKESKRNEYYRFEKYVTEIGSFIAFFDSRYLSELIKNLNFYIPKSNEKDKISQLTRLLIPELFAIGFSKSYLYTTNRNYFFGTARIIDQKQIEEFLDLFTIQKKLYNITFKVSSEFCNFDEELLNKFEIYLSEDCPGVENPNKYYFLFAKTSKEYSHFLTIKNIIAKDPYTARSMGEKYLEKLFDFIKYYIHNSKCSWDNTGLCIYNEEKEEDIKNFFVAKPPTSPMLKIRDDTDNDKALLKGINLFTHLDQISNYHLYNSLNLHSCSISSQTPENQLMNLWTALETLLPPPGNNKTRIVHFVNTMGPLLGREYIFKLINDLNRNIHLYLNEKDLKKLHTYVETNFSEIDEKLPIIEKWILLTILYNNNKEKKDEINKLLGNNVLLRNRFYTISSLLKDTNSIKEKIESHNNRVKWHLQRIYRARNLITHKGELIYYISDLLENTHNYYHSIIDLIIKTQKKHDNQFKNIGTIFNFIKIEHELHLDSLKENQTITKENYKKYVLGEE